MQCPCGSGRKFVECCQPLLEGQSRADSPEQLMRSRYTAFCTKNWDYLVATVDPQKKIEFANAANKAWMQNMRFTNLEVLTSSVEGNKGFVEFKATYTDGSQNIIHHEKAKFRKLSGFWYFRP